MSEATVTKQRRGINWARVNWWVVVGIGAMHIGALGAFVPAFFSWSGVAILLVMTWLTGGIGITLTFHRLLTHRSFKTPKWFEYVLTTCGCLAWQGGPGAHGQHHRPFGHGGRAGGGPDQQEAL